MNDDEFMRFCQDNPDLKFERRKNGDIVFMANTGGETGNKIFELSVDFGVWNQQTYWGFFFDSSTAFRLPDTSIISPDIAGLERSRWEGLTGEEQKKILYLSPDFVLELRSPSDRLKDCREKMDDWMANGCRLGWLIDLSEPKTYIYRPGQEPQEVSGLGQLSGEAVLPGFVLDLATLG